MDKTKAKEMGECLSAYGAAFAAVAAGEEGAEHKVAECDTKFGSKMKEYSSSHFNADVSGTADSIPGGAYSEEEAKGEEETELAADPLSDTGEATHNKSEFAAVVATNQTLQKQNRLLMGQVVRWQYEKKRDALLAQGHQFDTESADSMFSACADSKNPVEQVKRLFQFLGKTPKRDMLSSIPSVFGADAGQPATRGKHPEPTEKEMSGILDEMYNATGKTYSADDWKLGSAFDNMFTADSR